jgi:hypothetical protein
MSSRPPYGSGPSPVGEEWQSTRNEAVPKTQFEPDKEDYLSGGAGDIGRQVSRHQRELFVSCDPAEAMQQQFEHLRPEYIALHDIGTQSSRKLLTGVAAASGREIQRLMIRRQGYGTSLATLEFLDFGAEGRTLRLYITEADADTHERQELARVLLAYSRLAVLLIGDLPPHLLTSTLGKLRESMITGSWTNRNLLLLPLAHASTISSLGVEMGRGTGVSVTTTPQVTRPAQAWGFVAATWNRLREQLAAAGTPLPALPGTSPGDRPPVSSSPMPFDGVASRPMPITAPAPLDMQPMPSPTGAAVGVSDEHPVFSRYCRQLLELTGMVSCCVFEIASGRALAHAGSRPAADDLGQHGAGLLAVMASSSRNLGLGHTPADAAITLGAHHLLVRPLPHHPGLAMHAVLDKTNANLTLVRLQVGRLDGALEPVR